MKFTALLHLHLLDIFVAAVTGEAHIPIYPLTDVNEVSKTGYFSDPFHVRFEGANKIYFSGTTQSYLKCDGEFLRPKCASKHNITYKTGEALRSQLPRGTQICSVAGIHPFQSDLSGGGANRSWDAVVTLHIQDTPDCDGITGWSVIAHAHPADPSSTTSLAAETSQPQPPTHWVGDKLLVGSFSAPEPANYDGKYFRNPRDGRLYLLFSKQQSPKPKHRDGVAAWPMDDPRTITPGTNPTFLLVPDDDLNSENYHANDTGFKLIETGNVRAIGNKLVMAYSVGAFNEDTYKLAVAYSDTFLPRRGPHGNYYRKVMKDNPDHLWGTASRPKEVYYLLQGEEKHTGWRYVGDRVLAPGVPTVARIGDSQGSGGGWVLTFAGYKPGDVSLVEEDDNSSTNKKKKYKGNHRRPFYIDVKVNVPGNVSVEEASDEELQGWIVPVHGQRRDL